MPQPLTDRQREAYRIIVESLRGTGRPPTLREIGDQMGIGSTNGVNDHLTALERKGWVTRDEGARSVMPVSLGSCACCGSPIFPDPDTDVEYEAN